MCRRRAWPSSCPAPGRCASTCSGSAASCASRTASARCSTSWSPPALAKRSPASGGGSTLLTADLVHARRRGQELRVVPLDRNRRARAVDLAAAYLAIARSHEGRTRDEIEEAWGGVEVPSHERRLADGIRKLIEDG